MAAGVRWGRVLAIGVPIAVVGFGLLAAASSAEDADGSLDEGIVVWPLPDWPPDTVQEWRTGARTFGAPRSSSSSGSHVHAGVDLGPPKVGEPGRAYGARVLSPVAGRVELVGGGWDGAEAKRIEIVSPVYGRIVLGAVQKKAEVAEGELVRAGQLVGWVGRYPGGSTMLHLEQHAGPRVRWATGAPQPDGLIDPRKGVLKAYV